MKRIVFSAAWLISLWISPSVFGQLGINKVIPDPKSVLDMQAPENRNKTLNFPLSQADPNNTDTLGPWELFPQIGGTPPSSLVFDEQTKSFFYRGYASAWQELSPFTALPGWKAWTNGYRIGLEVQEPYERLHVYGDVLIAATDYDVETEESPTRLPGIGNLVVERTMKSEKVITESLEVQGFSENALVPTGAIIMWSGTTIPDGWHLCDGTDGTPDLRGRFIVGATTLSNALYSSSRTDPGRSTDGLDNPNYSVGDTGGKFIHRLSVGELPSHNHIIPSSGLHDHPISVDLELWSMTSASPGSRAETVNGIQNNYANNSTPNCSGPVQNKSCPRQNPDKKLSSVTPSSGAHTHPINHTGGDQPHENRPPYYTLAYIIKL